MRIFPTWLALPAALACAGLAAATAQDETTTEFCMEGHFDLGWRLQGLRPASGERYPTRWCISTDDQGRVLFAARGNSNPDQRGDFVQSYPAPRTVRIVNADDPPDLEFADADVAAEAAAFARVDPRRLLEEFEAHPQWRVEGAPPGWQRMDYPGASAPVDLRIADGRLLALRTEASLPLRGDVQVIWEWSGWAPAGNDPGSLRLSVDGTVLFEAETSRRRLDPDEAARLWAPSGGVAPRRIPGVAWPSRMDMRLETLDEGVYRVRGVRTGFHHLVVDTAEGLVVVDAPAGWVELAMIPPADLVPGLGVSGLSGRMVDFLAAQLPGRPLRAVVLTHAHDDHAGGARPFAAAGARIYAPAEVAGFLEAALGSAAMPPDRLSRVGGAIDVVGVGAPLRLDDGQRPVELWPIGPNPHVASMLAAWLPEQSLLFVSDLHVGQADPAGPAPARTASECWFARWARASLPPGARVLDSHSLAEVPRADFDAWLRSGACPPEPAG